MAVGSRKVIGFDLDTKAMQEYYPNSNWRQGYEDIRKFMQENDFEWKHGSVYISNKQINYQEIVDLTRQLIKEHPWLNLCMRDCIMADIGWKHSLNMLFDKNINLDRTANNHRKHR